MKRSWDSENGDRAHSAMGAAFQKPQQLESDISDEKSAISENNGLIINDFYFPPEVIELILSFLNPILNGRLVCKAWQEMIDTPSFWREKVLREVPGATLQLFHKNLNWSDYYQLCKHKPHKRNMIRNGSAEEGFLHWSIESTNVRNEWSIENAPVGCDPFPAGITRCFVTTYCWCSAEQIINLRQFGLTSNFMKHAKPNIHVEEWHAGRFDCGYQYSLKVTLVNSSWQAVDSFECNTTDHSTEWVKVEHCFPNHEKEIAAIVFSHAGKDTQFWAGHYGCKMSGAKVYVTLPGVGERSDE